MRVYVLEDGEYSERHVAGVYSTEADAQAQAARILANERTDWSQRDGDYSFARLDDDQHWTIEWEQRKGCALTGEGGHMHMFTIEAHSIDD